MKRVETLEGVKLGDKFIVHARYGSRRIMVECKKVTPKFADIGNSRYKITNADGWGGDRWERPPCLYVATPEIMAEVQAATDREKRIERLKTFDWSIIDNDGIERVAKAVAAEHVRCMKKEG